jgi:hypothetical protein
MNSASASDCNRVHRVVKPPGGLACLPWIGLLCMAVDPANRNLESHLKPKE